jgi:hypothetical protein
MIHLDIVEQSQQFRGIYFSDSQLTLANFALLAEKVVLAMLPGTERT